MECLFLIRYEVMIVVVVFLVFFFQAEDGIRDLVRSRGLGDVYKRQVVHVLTFALFLVLLFGQILIEPPPARVRYKDRPR